MTVAQTKVFAAMLLASDCEQTSNRQRADVHVRAGDEHIERFDFLTRCSISGDSPRPGRAYEINVAKATTVSAPHGV